jgi:hypothetical protein
VDNGYTRTQRYWLGFILSVTLYPLPLTLSPVTARASGEIAFVRAPEQIPAGDDITILVSASARETDIDRTLAVEYPESWKFKRAWRVEAGSDHAVKLAAFAEVTALLLKESGHAALALADYSEDFDPDADGIAYFIVFATNPLGGNAASKSVTVKAALIERTNPDAPTEIDPKTKKPVPVNMNWRMTFPSRYDFSFNEITSKRFMASVEMERVPRASRALVMDGGKHAVAEFHGRPELLQGYFQHPFSVQLWFRTMGYEQNLLRMQSEDSSEIRLVIGLLGQVSLDLGGTRPHVLLASRSVSNDGAWHNLVLSKDSVGNLRLFVDAGPPATGHASASFFKNISSLAVGDSTKTNNDFSIDELRLLKSPYRDASEFQRDIATSYRDTAHRAFAVFHFDDYGATARSSVSETAPMSFSLDSDAYVRETTSPVAPEPATLDAELLSPTRVSLAWNVESELGVKQYTLERRAGPDSPFEKVLSIEAKHGMKTAKRGQSIISRATYRASEDLPAFNGDIDLFYRIAILGFNDKEPPVYTVPVKLEYAPNRDVFVEQNEPNPFDTATAIAFRLTKPETVRLSIFDMMGREVAVLVDEKLAAGRHAYDLDAANWPPGIYFYKVKTAAATVTRKMVLLK